MAMYHRAQGIRRPAYTLCMRRKQLGFRNSCKPHAPFFALCATKPSGAVRRCVTCSQACDDATCNIPPIDVSVYKQRGSAGYESMQQAVGVALLLRYVVIYKHRGSRFGESKHGVT